MASRPTRSIDERNEIIHNELVHIKEALSEMKSKLGTVVTDIASIKFSEISELKGDIKVLKDRAGRQGAIAGIISGAFISGIISLVLGLIAHSK